MACYRLAPTATQTATQSTTPSPQQNLGQGRRRIRAKSAGKTKQKQQHYHAIFPDIYFYSRGTGRGARRLHCCMARRRTVLRTNISSADPAPAALPRQCRLYQQHHHRQYFSPEHELPLSRLPDIHQSAWQLPEFHISSQRVRSVQLLCFTAVMSRRGNIDLFVEGADDSRTALVHDCTRHRDTSFHEYFWFISSNRSSQQAHLSYYNDFPFGIGIFSAF